MDVLELPVPFSFGAFTAQNVEAQSYAEELWHSASPPEHRFGSVAALSSLHANIALTKVGPKNQPV